LIDKSASNIVNSSDAKGRTALHTAAECKNIDVVNFLIASRADNNQVMKYRVLPIHSAFIAGITID